MKLVKAIRASAVDEHGNKLYPYAWNNKFAKVPTATKKNMRRPAITPEIMSGLARYKDIFYRLIFILLGATGARIGEMLAVEIDKHISSDFRTISIEQKVHKGLVENRLKTEASRRKVDLHPDISVILRWFMADRKTGFLFPGQGGNRPISYCAVLLQLHRALEVVGYKNDYDQTSKAGSHIFRRYRITYLRNFTSFQRECANTGRDTRAEKTRKRTMMRWAIGTTQSKRIGLFACKRPKNVGMGSNCRLTLPSECVSHSGPVLTRLIHLVVVVVAVGMWKSVESISIFSPLASVIA